jgi:hypothetical protein
MRRKQLPQGDPALYYALPTCSSLPRRLAGRPAKLDLLKAGDPGPPSPPLVCQLHLSLSKRYRIPMILSSPSLYHLHAPSTACY